MNKLRKPLKNDVSLSQKIYNEQKPIQESSSQMKPFEIVNLHNLNQEEKEGDQAKQKTILKISLMINFAFQIFSFVLVILDFQLRLLGLESDKKIISIDITYSLSSLLSIISYLYILNQFDYQKLQSLQKQFKISLFITLITFILGITLFSVIVNEDLSCYITQTGSACQRYNQYTQAKQISECQIEVTPEVCSSKKITSTIKFTILIISGVPLILMVVANFQIYKLPLDNNTFNQNIKSQENRHSQKLFSSPDIEDKSSSYKSRNQMNPYNFYNLGPNIKKSFLHIKPSSFISSQNVVSNDQL